MLLLSPLLDSKPLKVADSLVCARACAQDIVSKCSSRYSCLFTCLISYRQLKHAARAQATAETGEKAQPPRTCSSMVVGECDPNRK